MGISVWEAFMKKERSVFRKISRLIWILFLVGLTKLNVSADEVNAPGIYINEICAKNTTAASSDGNYYDWIELYNSEDYDVDISGYGLSDKKKNPFKWRIPDGTVIPSKGYLVIYCDTTKSKDDESFANFSLSTDGETIIFSAFSINDENTEDVTPITVDVVEYADMEADISYGRKTDGASEFGYFDTMSMGAMNLVSNIRVDVPKFSKEAGFYDDSFSLELSCEEGCTIYYTTDGSMPTTDSNVYSEAILISDRSTEQNKLSSYGDISTFGYTPPSDLVDKSNVIRAIAVNQDGKSSKAELKTYFVNYENKAEYYKDTTIVSLVTDEDNLFSDDRGIYVLGDTYKNWLESGGGTSSNKYTQPANYRQEGSEWERAATIQVMDYNGSFYSQDVGIRIHGGWSRAACQKSFSIYARSSYGSSKIDFDLYNGSNQSKANETIATYDSIILRNTGNDREYTRFKDHLGQMLVANRAVSVQQMKPCIVFINGEYWGQYDITEKYSEDYFADHYGVDKDTVTIIKNGLLDEGSEEEYQEYLDLFEWVKNTDFSAVENYNVLQTKIDIDSLIDYMAFEIYVGNADGPTGNNNISWWKATGDEDNPYADDKWRFAIFDVDDESAWNMNNVAKNTFNGCIAASNFASTSFRKLLDNEEFKEKFVIAFMDMANDNFDSEKVLAVIDDLGTQYQDYAIDYQKRFNDNHSYTEDDYETQLESLRYFAQNRKGYAAEYLKSTCALTGDLVNVTVQNEDEKGSVALNTLALTMDEDTGSWLGQYYTDYNVTLVATPKDGYEFAYFQLSDGEKLYDESVSINLTDDVVITPVYKVVGEEDGVDIASFDIKSGTAGEELSKKVAATGGVDMENAKLTASMDGSENKKLKYSKAEYQDGESKNITVPILEPSSTKSWTKNAGFTVQCSTVGYENLTFSAALGATKKGAKDYVLQYSLDGETYADIPESEVSLTDNKKLCSLYSEFALPEECADQNTVYIRIKIASNETVGGAAYVYDSDTEEGSTSGEIAINHVSVAGQMMEHQLTHTEELVPSTEPVKSETTAPSEEVPAVAETVNSEESDTSETSTSQTQQISDNQSGKSLAKGKTIKDTSTKSTYKVTSSEGKTPTVTYTGTTNKKAKTITIPATITVDGVTYKVTAIADKAFKNHKTITKIVIGKNVTTIGKNAFSGCKKLKTIIIKSKKLTSKSVSKNAFKGISSKVTIKVPKSKVKAYTKLFRKKGLNKKVKVRAYR
jgi:hypothetical protein